jgi:rhodanese-related sulfurtransferase
MKNISVKELKSRLDAGETINLLDVRQPEETAEFNIGGIALPLGQIQRMQTDEIEDWRDQEIICYCRSGNRSGIAAILLEEMGFSDVKNLTGGMLKWKELIK